MYNIIILFRKTVRKGKTKMFCTKCGKEMPDDACFCANCGNNTSKSIQKNEEFRQAELSSRSVYPAQHIDYINKYNEILLYDNERIMIIVVGLAYIAAGLITVIKNAISADSLTSDNFKTIFTVSLYLGLCINLVFGIGIIMKKRWAVLTVRVFMIIGAVFNVFEILSLLVQLNELIFSSLTYEIDYLSIIFLLINTAFNIAMIVFTSMIARTLAYDVQNYRMRIQSRRRQSILPDASDNRSFWICRKCGSHNNISNSSCKDCGNYK